MTLNTEQGSVGPQTLSHYCTFRSRPLTLGSKGNSSAIQHHVKMELKYQMCMCFMVFRQDKLAVCCDIHRQNNAFLYTFLYNVFVTFLSRPWFRSVYFIEVPHTLFLLCKPWSLSATNILPSCLLQAFLC